MATTTVNAAAATTIIIIIITCHTITAATRCAHTCNNFQLCITYFAITNGPSKEERFNLELF
ncbi:hypothetical protein GBA52_023995 [Prunus armeniaca]|nr:hypothetical protein GBA52_023995 [Prunus armeniaca]